VYIWPTNQTIPPNGIPGGNCSLSTVRGPTGITVDSVGNVYISSLYCNWITKWAPNATSSTLFAGSPTGNSGWDNVTLSAPYGLALDEVNSFLYVADRYNSRIQRFPLNGSGVGVTVAGDLSTGTASNELYRPTDVYLSKLDGSLYIVDCYNNRIQNWAINATFGITVAGDPNGASGNTPYLLNRPYAFAFDNQEQYMYVSDSGNNRIQRFNKYSLGSLTSSKTTIILFIFIYNHICRRSSLFSFRTRNIRPEVKVKRQNKMCIIDFILLSFIYHKKNKK
jgi:DNA-binding beta-propeller fold protein YncE